MSNVLCLLQTATDVRVTNSSEVNKTVKLCKRLKEAWEDFFLFLLFWYVL